MTSQALPSLKDLCSSTSASFPFTLLNQWVAWRCGATITASGEPHPPCPAVVGTQTYKLPVISFTPLTDTLQHPETGCPRTPTASSWEQDPWNLKDSHQVRAASVCALGKYPFPIHLCHLQHIPASRKGNASSSHPKTLWLCIQAAGPALRKTKGSETI